MKRKMNEIFKLKGIYFLLGAIIFSTMALLMIPGVSSGVGQNVVVSTQLEVGNVFPEILNISVNEGTSITLTPNETTTVLCQALIQDWNNDTDIVVINATLYDTSLSTWDGADDNNYHYSNSTCVKQEDTAGLFEKVEDEWHAIANCTFEVEYYANAGDWNCSVFVEDTTSLSSREEDSGSINSLLAIGVQDVINYGIVDSTKVSDEQEVSVANVGNTQLNLTLEGYAQTPQDGYAMNCSKGSSPFIDIFYEKYNLTASNVGPLTLSEADGLHLNLTSPITAPVREFNLDARQNDVSSEAVKPTYWRIYVPKGLAGTCEGNIVFGAAVAPAD